MRVKCELIFTEGANQLRDRVPFIWALVLYWKVLFDQIHDYNCGNESRNLRKSYGVCHIALDTIW